MALSWCLRRWPCPYIVHYTLMIVGLCLGTYSLSLYFPPPWIGLA